MLNCKIDPTCYPATLLSDHTTNPVLDLTTVLSQRKADVLHKRPPPIHTSYPHTPIHTPPIHTPPIHTLPIHTVPIHTSYPHLLSTPHLPPTAVRQAAFE